ncbi:uncharacterized protein BDV17DRAFT_230872 [Aspergillus undulatus]|uniref:uncharacterized protein n=1 Tax=Aspergillus undulatus TaxID=1810928 RepID=UPI003CCE3F86
MWLICLQSTERAERPAKHDACHEPLLHTGTAPQPPQPRGTTSPSFRHTRHVSWDPAISQDTNATMRVDKPSTSVCSAPPSASAQLSANYEPEAGLRPPLPAPRQPSVPASMSLPDQFFTHAVQNLIQCAHALAQHKTYLSEMNMKQDAEAALVRQELQSVKQSLNAFSEIRRKCDGFEKMLEGMSTLETKVEGMEKLTADVAVIDQLRTEATETLRKVDDISKKVAQIEGRVQMLDGLENLSALDMLRGCLGPNTK